MNKLGYMAKKRIKNQREVYVIWAILLMMVILACLSLENFGNARNLMNIIGTALPLLLCAYGQMFVIFIGGIDLSVGPIVSVVTVIMAKFATESSGGWIVPVVISFLSGTLFGVVNGLIVTKGKQEPIIATLTTMSIATGLALAIQPTAGVSVKAVAFCRTLSGSKYMWVPITLTILVTAIVWYVFSQTSLGMKIYAVGGSVSSAVSGGVNVDKIKMIVFTMSGFFSALGGIYLATLLTAGTPTAGDQYTMRTITAVIVGGTLLTGGKGSALGTVAGTFIIMMLNSILNFMGVITFWQYVFQGVMLVGALTITSLRNRRKN